MESKGNTYKKDDLELIKLVGKGSYGEVHQAKDKKYGRIVAVKILKLDENWLPLLQEINMVIDMYNETIVNYYGWFFDGPNMWIIMEYCDGGSLSDIMRVCQRPLTEKETAAVLRGVIESLVYVHSLNRIHRDIKAGNILLTSDGRVKLCDFGVSAQLDDALSKTGTRIGSPYWMAPEVISGTGHNTKADIWSLGITALELIQGRPPLSNLPSLSVLMKIPTEPPPRAPKDSSPLFQAFIARILVKDPESRPTAVQLLEDDFIKTTNRTRAQEIIRNIVSSFVEAKNARGDNLEEEEYMEEEEEEEEEDACDDSFSMPSDNELSTMIFGDGTFISAPEDSDGTCVISTPSANQSSGLSGWKMEFVDTPSPSPVGAKPKSRFGHFSPSDLKIMLERLRKIAEDQLKDSSSNVSPHVIRSNYEDCRQNIIMELKKHDPKTPDDFMVL